MREGGMSETDLRRFGMTNENYAAVMGYNTEGDREASYIPTSEERYAVEMWVVAGYKSPLKLKEMLLEEFELDLSVNMIQRAFRVELLLGKEKIAVQATKNVVAAIKEGDVPSSFRFLESAGKWNGKDGATPGGGGGITVNNTQINISAQDAVSTYQKLVKGN